MRNELLQFQCILDTMRRGDRKVITLREVRYIPILLDAISSYARKTGAKFSKRVCGNSVHIRLTSDAKESFNPWTV